MCEKMGAEAAFSSKTDVSYTVRVARVVCIFLMTYAHAAMPKYDPATLTVLQARLIAPLEILQDLVSHASVPLLSVVSGWLFVTTFKDDASRTLVSKVRTLLVPLLLWNIVMALVYVASSLVVDPEWTFSAHPSDLLDDFLAFADRPLNRPLYFLRDIFVCSLAGLAIMWLAKRRGAAAFWLALAGAVLLAILLPKSIVMQRAVILPSFVIGMIVGDSRANVMDRHFVSRWLVVPSVLTLIAIDGVLRLDLVSVGPGLSGHLLELVNRILLAICAWSLVRVIARTALGPRIAPLERYVFFVFCSHFVLFMSVSALASRLLGERNPLLFLLFIVEPFVAFAAGAAAFELLARFATPLLALLNGGRVRARTGADAVPTAPQAAYLG